MKEGITMNEKNVINMFKQGFSIDYIIQHFYLLENKNFVNYSIDKAKYVFDDKNYTSKETVRGFVYRTLYKNFYKNTALSNKRSFLSYLTHYFLKTMLVALQNKGFEVSYL